MSIEQLIIQNRIKLNTKWKKRYPYGKLQIAIGKSNTIAAGDIKFIHHTERHTANSICSIGINNKDLKFKNNEWALYCFYTIYNFNNLEKFIIKATKLNCPLNMLNFFVNFYMKPLIK